MSFGTCINPTPRWYVASYKSGQITNNTTAEAMTAELRGILFFNNSVKWNLHDGGFSGFLRMEEE